MAHITPNMIDVRGGKFRPGDPDDNRAPVDVKSFAMSEDPITFEQYDAFCEDTNRQKPSDNGWGRGKQPVINVSYFDAVAFCEWLSEKTGKTFRLPTEEEWEYAARAGTETKYWWGDEITREDKSLLNCAFNGPDHPTPGGTYPPNPFGLRDMNGNVWEWTSTAYNPTTE